MHEHLDHDTTRPNHHAHHRGFAGVTGWLAAMSMRFGRTGDARLAATVAALRSGERLVDIGCGPGVAALVATDHGAVVTGVDPSAPMLAVARRSDRRGRVTWLDGGAEALPLPDGSHDVAWSLASVHHWPDLDGGIGEALRVLRPGGRFLAMERLTKAGATGLASHGWTIGQAEAFAASCATAGFVDTAVSTHDSGRGRIVAVLAHRGPDESCT